MFEDQLLYPSSKVQFCQSIILPIGFYVYAFYFYALIFDITIIPNFTYSYWFIIIIFLSKKGPNISNYSIFNCFIFVFQFIKISYTFNYVFFRLFLYFQFCLFFLTLPYMFFFYHKLYCVCLKKTYNFILKTA